MPKATIFLHNETDSTLSLLNTHSELGDNPPPPDIPARTTRSWSQSSPTSASPVSGHCQYGLEESGRSVGILTISWLVNSDGKGNEFKGDTDTSTYVVKQVGGGEGTDVTVHFHMSKHN